MQHYREQVDHITERITKLEQAIDEAVKQAPPAIRAVIEALQALRGVAQTNTATVVAKLGSLSRFASPSQLMGYSGLVPREHTSGNRVQRGAITNSGNASAQGACGSGVGLPSSTKCPRPGTEAAEVADPQRRDQANRLEGTTAAAQTLYYVDAVVWVEAAPGDTFPIDRGADRNVYRAEYANLDAADKTLVEVVGRDGKADLILPNQNARREKAREVETRLILGSSIKGWALAENLIAEKNLSHAPFEFGYTVGVSRPVSLAPHPAPCNLCAKNFQAGLELYRGLGTADDFNFRGTSRYIAPVASWTLTSGTTLQVSLGFGVTRASAPFLLRIGVSYGFDDFGRAVRNLFSNHAPEPEST